MAPASGMGLSSGEHFLYRNVAIGQEADRLQGRVERKVKRAEVVSSDVCFPFVSRVCS